MFLYCLKQAARRISTDESNHHRHRIAEDADFYEHWLVPRIERFYKKRGWSVDDACATGGFEAKKGAPQSSHRLACPPKKFPRTSSRFCGPLRTKVHQRIKHSLGCLKRRRRRDKAVTEVVQPQVRAPLAGVYRLLRREKLKRESFSGVGRQVEQTCIGQALTRVFVFPVFFQAEAGNLVISERLLDKWHARRETRRGGKSGTFASLRLLVSVLAAMFAAFLLWLFVSDAREACRCRVVLAFAFFVASVVLSGGLR